MFTARDEQESNHVAGWIAHRPLSDIIDFGEFHSVEIGSL